VRADVDHRRVHPQARRGRDIVPNRTKRVTRVG
jgi:hypothetical protein